MVCAVGLFFPPFACVFCFFTTSADDLCHKEGTRAMPFGGGGGGGGRIGHDSGAASPGNSLCGQMGRQDFTPSVP